MPKPEKVAKLLSPSTLPFVSERVGWSLVWERRRCGIPVLCARAVHVRNEKRRGSMQSS